MFQPTKRGTFVLGLVLVCLPLTLVGCGGGNGGGIGQPTPTLTTVPTATLPAASGNANLQFTGRVETNLPAALNSSLAQGQLYTQSGTTNVQISLDSNNQAGTVNLQLGREGTISTPEVFLLEASGDRSAPLNNSLNYSFGGQTYVSQGGSCTILLITPVPGSNTVTVQFSLTDVRMVNTNNPNSTFTLNGSGNVTLNQFAL